MSSVSNAVASVAGHEPARVTGARRLILVVAVALAGLMQAEVLAGRQTPLQLAGFLLAAIAFALVVPVSAVPPGTPVRVAASVGMAVSAASKSRRWWAMAVGGPLALLLVALVLFWLDAVRGLAFALWWLAMVLFVAACGWQSRRARQPATERLPPQPSWARPLCLPAAVAILAAVAAVTFYRLGSIPYGLWWDEASLAQIGREIAQGRLNFPMVVPLYGPALQTYFHAATQLVFPSTTLAPRLVSGICGVVGVGLLGALVVTVWDRSLALIAMAVLGFMRWHLDFSRIGMNQSVFVCFELATLAALALALQRRSPVWFAICGVMLGLTMHMYYAADLLTALVALAIACSLVAGRPRLPRRLAALTLIGFALAYAPLLEAAIQSPADYSGRIDAVSIFSPANMEPPLQALEHNLRLHALMFNVDGDRNGRHNIPGQPELDAISAVLFVLGLAWCLRHIRDPRYGFTILLFLAMMAAGVFSLDFEAPQTARAAGAQVPVALFVSLALYGAINVTATGWPRRWSRFSPVVMTAALVAVTAWVGVNNVSAYFDAQTHNEAVWESYSTDATFVARQLLTLPPRERTYISPVLTGQPTESYLAPGRGHAAAIEPATDLPFGGRGPVAVFLARDDEFTFPLLQSYYPHATFRVLQGPDHGVPPLVFEALLSRRDVRRIQGLHVIIATRHHIVRRHTSGLDLPANTPAGATTIVWRGGIHIPHYGRATLTIITRGHVTLHVDGKRICSETGTIQCRRIWARGNHSLLARMTTTGRRTSMQWHWSRPRAPTFYTAGPMGHGLAASYYPNNNWHGEPALVQVEPQVDYYYQLLPLPRPFTVRWRGYLYAPASGSYRFSLDSIDDSWLKIDGRRVMHAGPTSPTPVSTALVRGWHRIQVRLLAVDNYTHIFLTWSPPGQTALLPIPDRDLEPSATSCTSATRRVTPPAANAHGGMRRTRHDRWRGARTPDRAAVPARATRVAATTRSAPVTGKHHRYRR